MNNRNRTAPIALARNAPITQAILRLLFTCPFLLQQFTHLIKGCLKTQTVQIPTIDIFCIFFIRIPFLPSCCIKSRIFRQRGFNYLTNGQIVFGCKLKIAFIMSRHRHNRTVPIAPQHIVGNPHRQFFAIHRVNRKTPSRHTFFLHSG